MDFITISFGAATIIIIALIVYKTGINKRKREKQFLQSLSNIAAKQNCKITKYELMHEMALGLDDDANYLFFLRGMKENEVGIHINLSEYQSCKMINTARTVSSREQKSTVVDKLELKFVAGSKNIPDAFLEFYNSEYSAQLNGELQFIEKWQSIINDKLNHKRKKNS